MRNKKAASVSMPENVLFPNEKEEPRRRKILRNSTLLLLIMILCTTVSMIFNRNGALGSNIVMIYLLGILLFSYLAVGHLYSFLASVTSVLLYNFFFTEPYLTFHVYSQNDLITFLVMFIVGFITSMLTLRVKRETGLAKDREAGIKALYQIGRKLLGVKSDEALAQILAEAIAGQFEAAVSVEFFNPAGDLRYRYIEGKDVFLDERDRAASKEAYQSGSPCGYSTLLFPESKAFYLPVVGQSGVLGVVGISLSSARTLSREQKEFLETIMPKAAVVLERERLYEKQQKTQMQVQRERLRADMLRSISHDLRTPLTGIMGLASTVLDHYNTISDEVKQDFLRNIYQDADWLNELVENILNTTRFEEGNMKLIVGEEAAEEIVAEAISHVRKRTSGQKIIVDIPDELILLQVDGVLIRQVLVNLLSNAINQTTDQNQIIVSLYCQGQRVFFQVSDNGPGIAPQDLPYVFERFYQGGSHNQKGRGGIGLGLSLCKSIVEAHEGEISIENLEPHGTRICFYIPMKE